MKYLFWGLSAAVVIFAVGCIVYKTKRSKRTADEKRAQSPATATASDDYIIDSMPPDLRAKCGVEILAGCRAITREWLTDEIFLNVFCGDTDAMSRLCRHIVESSNGRYHVAASIGDKFDATRMTETAIVSGDHYVSEIKTCGVIDAVTGKVLFKAIVK